MYVITKKKNLSIRASREGLEGPDHHNLATQYIDDIE